MGSSIKDSSSPGVGACPQPARHAELEELDSYAGEEQRRRWHASQTSDSQAAGAWCTLVTPTLSFGAAVVLLACWTHTGYCVGLGPVLEAVDELPPSGSPIPASAQSRVKQFFTQQLSTDTGTAPRPLRIRPPELQDLKQLHKSLQQHAKTFRYEGAFQVPPIVVAAAQLVADGVRQVARQQVLEKNSPAYGVLLDEGYRAGVSLAAHMSGAHSGCA
jgi:hypothetical protein